MAGDGVAMGCMSLARCACSLRRAAATTAAAWRGGMGAGKSAAATGGTDHRLIEANAMTSRIETTTTERDHRRRHRSFIVLPTLLAACHIAGHVPAPPRATRVTNRSPLC